MSEQKPREFWIKPAYKPEDEDRISFFKVPKNDYEHVVEFSALESAQKRIDKLVKFLEALENDQHDRVSGGVKDSITHLLANLEDIK